MTLVYQFCRACLLAAFAGLLPASVATSGVTPPVLPQWHSAPPVWAFIDAGTEPLEPGDYILCRCDAFDPDSPWYLTQLVSVEADGSLSVFQPVGTDVIVVVKISRAQVLDVARKL